MTDATCHNIINESFANELEAHVSRNPSSKELAVKLLKIGLPLSASQLAQFTINSMLISFAGHIGVHQLDGAALAIGLMNATCFAFGSGLSGALDTFLSHSYGRNQTSKMYGIYAQRMAVILAVASVPLMVLFFFMSSFLGYLGQNPEVVHFTGTFCTVVLFGIPFGMSLELLRRYYTNQHVTMPLTVTLVASATLNPLLLLISTKLFGFAGVPLVWVVLQIGMVTGLVLHLNLSGLLSRTWSGFNLREATSHLWPMLKLAIPSLGMMLSEWASWEVNGICAGFAEPYDLAGYTISIQVAACCWCLCSGMYSAASVMMGNAIGDGHPELGARITAIAGSIVLTMSCINIIIVITFEDEIPMLFTTDPKAIDSYKGLIRLFLIFHVVDTFQSNMLAILRGCGLQNIGALIVTTVFTVVGMPLGITLFFWTRVGVIALWIGPVVGAFGVGLPSYAYLFLRYIDWRSLKPHTDKHLPAGVDEEKDSFQEPAEIEGTPKSMEVDSPEHRV